MANDRGKPILPVLNPFEEREEAGHRKFPAAPEIKTNLEESAHIQVPVDARFSRMHILLTRMSILPNLFSVAVTASLTESIYSVQHQQ